MTSNIGPVDNGHTALEINGLKIDVPCPWQFRLAVVIAVLIPFVYSVIWITKDAEHRGKSGFLAFLFVFAAGWPFSLLWWVWLRPRFVEALPPLPLAPRKPPLP
jgi:hypothetical protein